MQNDESTSTQGSLAGLTPGKDLEYVLRRRFANKAGEHLDLRLGNRTRLLS